MDFEKETKYEKRFVFVKVSYCWPPKGVGMLVPDTVCVLCVCVV